MAESTHEAQAAVPGVNTLLQCSLERVREVQEMVVTADLGYLGPCSLRLQQAANNLRSALTALRAGCPSASERKESLFLSGKLSRQLRHLAVLLDGWASFLSDWQRIRQCYEYGYTVGGAPSGPPVVSHPRGEL